MRSMQWIWRVLVGASACGVFWLATGDASAWTLDESPRTVRTVGAHESPVGFVSLVEPISPNCAFGHLYFDLNTSLGKAMFATFAVAKTTGQKVRIGYTPPEASGMCWLQVAALV